MKSIREILPRGKEAAFASRDFCCSTRERLFLSPDPEWTMWAARIGNRRPVRPGCTDIAGNRGRRNRAGHVGGRYIWYFRGGGSSGARG